MLTNVFHPRNEKELLLVYGIEYKNTRNITILADIKINTNITKTLPVIYQNDEEECQGYIIREMIIANRWDNKYKNLYLLQRIEKAPTQNS